MSRVSPGLEVPEEVGVSQLALRVPLVFLLVLSVASARADGRSDVPPGDSPPPTAFDRIEAAGSADDHPGADWIVVLDDTVVRVDDRGVASTDSTLLVKVLTDKGCVDRSAQRWGYDPQSLEIDVEKVSVLRGGERIDVPVEDVLDVPAPQRAIYWRDRVKLLQLPRLEVGDGIEVRTSRIGFTYALLDAAEEAADDRFVPPMAGEYFDIVLFQDPVPTVEKRYEIRLPADRRLHSRVYNGALYASTTFTAEETVYSWWGRDLPAVPDEPSQPDASDFVTKVVAATVESWEAKSRWFFDVNESQFDSSPAIDAKVEEILAGVDPEDDDARAKALLHWVAQNIRYSGQTMGEGEGFTLHPGTMIFEQRSGVCKDIAGMLVTMLRAADIPAYAAMTMAGSRIEEVPADQFNHCVVARKTDDGYVMYDPTWVPFNNDIWSKLETEQDFLVGSPEGEMLARIPYSPPEESPLEVTHRARLDAGGNLVGRIRLEGGGASDGRLRRLVSRTPRDELRGEVAAILAAVSPAVEVSEVTHRRADDFSGDMWIEAEYRAPGLALPVAGGLELTSPALAVVLSDSSFFRAGAQKWADERASDVLLYFTQRVVVDERIGLPSGYEPVRLPEPTTVDETYAGLDASASSSDGEVRMRAEMEVRRRQIPPDGGYAGFVRVMEATRELADELIRIERAGGAS